MDTRTDPRTDRTVRDTATVTTRQPVDGTRHRRGGPRRPRQPRQPLVVAQVHPDLLAAAYAHRRDGERLVILSPTVVRLQPEQQPR